MSKYDGLRATVPISATPKIFEEGRVYLSSWSGGKDSCFACYQIVRSGKKVVGLLNCVSKEHQRVSFHGVDPALIQAQSELAGIPLLQKETTPDHYEEEFKEGVRSLSGALNITGMVFGDIYLDDHLRWVEGVCNDLGIKALEPLWGKNTEDVLRAFINSGFKAVVISGQAGSIDREWIGHPVDMQFLEYMKTRPGVDICGENGEYHTLVLGGPLFNGEIHIGASDIIEKDGYRFLDIKKFLVQHK
jgi:diphthine-ammonia ligase